MLRYLAKRYGKPFHAVFEGATGKGIGKHLKEYNTEYFARRGKKGQKKHL